MEQLYINEGNFFKERKDEKQTDNELAFTCYDVVEAICRYLNYTAVAEGDKLYLIDYDNIRNGNNQYTTYDLSGPTLSSTAVTIADNTTLQASMYQGSNNNISLDNVYSKVSVTDNLYTFDNALPELFNYQATNITAADDWTKEDRVFTGSTIDDWEMQTVASGNTIQTADGLMNSITDRNYHTFMKYYHNQPNYKFYWYEKDAGGNMESSTKIPQIFLPFKYRSLTHLICGLTPTASSMASAVATAAASVSFDSVAGWSTSWSVRTMET